MGTYLERLNNGQRMLSKQSVHLVDHRIARCPHTQEQDRELGILNHLHRLGKRRIGRQPVRRGSKSRRREGSDRRL